MHMQAETTGSVSVGRLSVEIERRGMKVHVVRGQFGGPDGTRRVDDRTVGRSASAVAVDEADHVGMALGASASGGNNGRSCEMMRNGGSMTAHCR